MPDKEDWIQEDKHWREALADVFQRVTGSARKSQERTLAMLKIQQAQLALGREMIAMNDGESYYTPKPMIVEPGAGELQELRSEDRSVTVTVRIG